MRGLGFGALLVVVALLGALALSACGSEEIGEVDRRVKEAAEVLGIANLLKSRPGQLSGG